MDSENLIKKISKHTGFKKKKCEAILEKIFGLISFQLKNKNNVSIEDFGSFRLIRKKPQIKLLKDIKTVFPPEDIVEFELSENTLKKINTNSKNE